MKLAKKDAGRGVISDALWGVWTRKRKGPELLPKMFQHTEVRKKRVSHQKGLRGSFQELARTPRGFVVTEAPTKLSVGFCDMVTTW